MKKILITGGAGFIGSNLTLKLSSNGYDVTILDNLSPQIHTTNPNNSPLFKSIEGKAKFIEGSVVDQNLLKDILLDKDYIIHLAAETGTGQSMYEINKYVDINIGGTSKIIQILQNFPNKVSKFIIASSRSIYGEGRYINKDGHYVYPSHRLDKDMKNKRFDLYDDNDKPLEVTSTSEDSKIHPSSIYGITKQVQEQLVMTTLPLINIHPVSLRFQNVYGPGQSLSNPYTGILSIFSNLIMNNKDINIFEDGLESRDFVYIDDVTESILLAIKNKNSNNQVFNVGSGIPINVMNVANKLNNLFDGKSQINISGNYRLGDIRHNYACLKKINKYIGYQPRVLFEDGLSKFVSWAKEVGPIKSDYNSSINEMKEKGLLK
tara:strand:- start:119 stop:1249 length:1131 start_codon:yes stop_codon:yes gene_type:complete